MWVAVLVHGYAPMPPRWDETEKARVILPEGGSGECIEDAIDSCPENCISGPGTRRTVLKLLVALPREAVRVAECGKEWGTVPDL